MRSPPGNGGDEISEISRLFFRPARTLKTIFVD